MGWLRIAVRRCDRAAVAVLVRMVRVYQWCVSPLLGRTCRFQPTCSEFFRAVVERDGAVTGTLRGIARICRCHPWHPGGHDPP
ncbi:MAG: membrane protein insertion efficiency factor YidD [Planctomycetia bacterium]|nr:membrane protein insertion efficiency factor YidD [Planctomycetia bacterium]